MNGKALWNHYIRWGSSRLFKDVIDFEQVGSMFDCLFTNDHKKRKQSWTQTCQSGFYAESSSSLKMYNFSSHQIEYQIVDWLREFFDIQSFNDVLDEKNVWKYKDVISESGVRERLFPKFNEWLNSMGFTVNKVYIMDTGLVIVYEDIAA